MREIKFDIVARNLHFNEIHHEVFTLDQIWEGSDISTWLKSNNSNIIAKREYTGLKDKNGTDVYEGDILGRRPYGYYRSDGKSKDGRYKGKEWQCFAVEWGEYDASEAGLVSGYEYETDGKYVGWNITVGGYDDDLKENEVIGNIYSNPELVDER